MRRANVPVFLATMAATTWWAAGCSPFSTDDSRSPPTDSANGSLDAGSDASAIPIEGTCQVGMWSSSAGESNSCVAWTICKPGTFTKNSPSATVDRACEPCASGTFSTGTNAAACTPWTACGSGEVEQTPGSSTTDRTCVIAPWTRQFGTSDTDNVFSVSADGHGSLYVAGETAGAFPGQTNAGSVDAVVRKFDDRGEELWTLQFGTTASDSSSSVSVDGNGNVYVVGYTEGTLPHLASIGGRDAFVRKYDSAGKELWTRQFGTNGSDEAHGVSVDGSGAVYVVGETFGAFPNQQNAGMYDAFIRKYDDAGNEQWTHQLGTKDGDSATSVSVDGSGNVYVAGFVGRVGPLKTSPGMGDAFVSKYDGAGKELWTRQFGSSSPDEANAVSVDESGNAYVVGHTSGTLPGQPTAGSGDAFVRKFDGAGKELWTQQFRGGTHSGADVASSVSADGNGNVYVVGSLHGPAMNYSPSAPFIRKYSGSGQELWTRELAIVGGRAGAAASVSVDRSGGVFVAGSGALSDQTGAGGPGGFVLRMNP